MSIAERVRRLVAKYFWEMPDNASLSTGENGVLPEEAHDFFEEYVESFRVDMISFELRRYFPSQKYHFYQMLFYQNICVPITINLKS
ncbi:hypothetical protein [Erwinia sp. CGal63]|uniref:hypothetical protein n=1 Tax=Erwinia sp. CGal63 TaxID=2919889 RepID=UPI003FA55021